MATFSPSPAPRRRYAASGAPRTSPPNPTRRVRAAGSRPPSRFATPLAGAESESRASVMDVDDHSMLSFERAARAETVFARSEELSAAFYANLPVEVKQVLKNADFFRDAYTGDIDTLTGFALVASAQTCFVWQHAQALTGTPTCYIFSCPLDYSQHATPFHSLVPSGSSREPGLILVSVDGDVRHWDSVASGLAGGQHFASTSLGLKTDEIVTSLVRSDPQTFIVSTSAGRLLRLLLTAPGGKSQLTFHAFSRPQYSSAFTRFLPSLWASPSSFDFEAENISAVALGERAAAGRPVWALMETRVQKWDMTDEGWEDLLLDEEVAGVVKPALRAQFASAPQDDSALDLELLDLALQGAGELIVLVSYAGTDDDQAMDFGAHPRRIYAIVRLRYVNGAFAVTSVGGVPYQSTSSSGAPMHPRLKPTSNGLFVGIQFGDAVAFCAKDSAYQDRLELKSASDRTLGVAVTGVEGEMLILTAATMLKATLNVDKVATFDPETGRAHLITSIMTQAILYGSIPQNPLHFSFPPEVDEDSLMAGAEQLSQAVLESDIEVVKPNHDLSAQMNERKERLSFLIHFINENGALTKMSQRSRQRLATDAEKLYAAQKLWLQHGHLLARTGDSLTVLNEAVYNYMDDAGEGHHEDFMRAFFRLRVADLGLVMPFVIDVVRRTSTGSPRTLPKTLSEANNILLCVLKAARDYREFNRGVYGLARPMIKPWTSKPALIEIVLELFDLTAKIVESPTNMDGNERGAKDEPLRQLPEIAAVLFACIYERLEWLGSAAAGDDAGTTRELKGLEERFSQLRPEALETLRVNGHIDSAFSLAEKYRDFRSLASLCNKEAVYPPHANPNAARIQSYINRFKEEFTTELYRWYIEHGELRAIFAQEDTQGPFIEKFFAENPNHGLSWIHELGNRRYAATSASLLDEATEAHDLVEKHLMLSIGKLAHIAQLHERGDEALVDAKVLDAFHDQLDFVSVHESLVDDLRAVLASVRAKQSLDMQVESIVRAKASSLSSRRALLATFRQLVRQLLQGKALSIEDVVDVLTLKDNTRPKDLEDFVTALHLLSRDETLPEARASAAVRTVWRRIYIHDDWEVIRQTANITDVQLSQRFRGTALYAVLQALFRERERPDAYRVLLPEQAQLVPTAPEVASRWPGLAAEEVEALERDYRVESARLGQLRLEDVLERVKDLALQDPVWA